MDTKDTQTNISAETTAPVVATVATPATPAARPAHGGAPRDSRAAGGRGGARRGPTREPRAKPEFDQKIISIRRVTRVASGGRRFSFSVAMVAGNRKGSVGVGTGKAGDTAIAIDKAMKNAKKHMIKLNLTKEMSIPYEIEAKYCSSRVVMMPSKSRGLVAGSSVRAVLELAGVKNITAKLRSGSKNRLNNARVAIKALSEFDGKNAAKLLTRSASQSASQSAK